MWWSAEPSRLSSEVRCKKGKPQSKVQHHGSVAKVQQDVMQQEEENIATALLVSE